MARETSSPATITGLEALRGEGTPVGKGFWADAWEHVLKQPTAVIGLFWVGVIALFAIFAPLVSSGHPLVLWEIDRRTSDDAAAWFRSEMAGGTRGLESVGSVRQGATLGTARRALQRELALHAGAPGATSILPAPTEASPDDAPLTISEVTRIAAALDASAALDATGESLAPTSPLLGSLKASDWTILIGGVLGIALLALPRSLAGDRSRGARAGLIALGGAQSVLTLVLAARVANHFTARDASDWARRAEHSPWYIPIAAASCALLAAAIFAALPIIKRPGLRIAMVVSVAAVVGTVVGLTWRTPPGSFNYMERERLGQVRAVYTIIPWSSNQRPADRDAATLPPGTTYDQALANVVRSAIPPQGVRPSTPADVAGAIRLARELPLASEVRDRIAADLESRFGGRSGVTPAQMHAVVKEQLAGVGKRHLLGTDRFGQDVLAQLIHACRLAISMGLVATGLATLIGVTMGSLMGYFGGWVDMILFRVVEMFMAIPVLFLLIVAAGVLERNTYVMMAIIGCVTWHGAARFTRAEFMKLRSQDFVQSAKAVGLPLRSILFRHMLPNGVTPVLVDASFGIAAAILFEAVLSYLGLGPPDQPSWGRVLSDAAGEAGTFNWWLGVFPGAAIFLTVLSLTMVGEALRDAIDPKLKKARV